MLETQAVGKKICAEKIQWVIVAGGDGTLRALVEECVDQDYWPYVSIYPAGTVNLVAKELMQKPMCTTGCTGCPKGSPRCAWGEPTTGSSDRGRHRRGSMVVQQVTPKEKKYLSTLAYVRQSGRVLGNEMLLHNWKYRFQVMINGDGVWHQASSVIVTKSRYYAGRFSLVNGGSLSNPTMHVCLFTKGRCVDFLRYTALIAADMLTLDKSVEIYPAQQVDIRCNVSKFRR